MRQKLILYLVLIFLTLTIPMSANADTTGTFFTTSGVDGSDGTSAAFSSSDISKLSASDDSRIQSNGDWPDGGAYDESKYIEFDFSPNIPQHATISSVVITHEFRRSGSLAAAKLEVWNGTQFIDTPLTVGSINIDHTDVVDVSSLVTTVSQVNSLKIRFLAYRATPGNTTTSHDVISVAVTYAVPYTPPQSFAQTISHSVDTSFPIILSGTSSSGNLLTYSVVSTSTKGTVSAVSANQVTYTPLGTIGDDSFDFKVNDGTSDSATSTVTIHLTPGIPAILNISANPTSLPVGSSTTLTVSSFDAFGNAELADNSTVVNLFSTAGSVASTTLTLFAGNATTTATSNVGGIVTYTASSASLVSTTTSVTFLQPTPIPSPIANPPEGTYTSIQNITLTASGTLDVYYTEDGSTPMCGTSTHFTSPILVDDSKTIKAISCDVNNHASDVSTFEYVVTVLQTQPINGGMAAGGGNFLSGTQAQVPVNAYVNQTTTTIATTPQNNSIESTGTQSSITKGPAILIPESTHTASQIAMETQQTQAVSSGIHSNVLGAAVLNSGINPRGTEKPEIVAFVILLIGVMYVFIGFPFGNKR